MPFHTRSSELVEVECTEKQQKIQRNKRQTDYSEASTLELPLKSFLFTKQKKVETVYFLIKRFMAINMRGKLYFQILISMLMCS